MVHMHHSCCLPQQESTDFWSNTRSQDNRLSHISLCGGTTQLYTCSRTHFHEHPKCFISSVLSSTNFNYLLQKEAYLSCSKTCGPDYSPAFTECLTCLLFSKPFIIQCMKFRPPNTLGGNGVSFSTATKHGLWTLSVSLPEVNLILFLYCHSSSKKHN